MKTNTNTNVVAGVFLVLAACTTTTINTAPLPDAGPGADAAPGLQLDGSTTDKDGGIPTKMDASSMSDAVSSADGGMCSAAKDQLLGPIAKTSAGDVSILGDTAGVKTLYVDAAAGGAQAQDMNPRTYVNLETGTKVSVTDLTAATSTAWDISFKRPVIFTNDGDGGSGKGGSAFLAGKTFDATTAADAAGVTFTTESFLDAECNPSVDDTGVVKTSFDGWYDYNQANNTLAPKAGTWIVKGGTGKLFKVQFLSYYATPDGGVGMAGGRFTLKVGAL